MKTKKHIRWEKSAKRIQSVVTLDRSGGKGKTAFYACVRIGKKAGTARRIAGTTTVKPAKTLGCAYGKNPRDALGRALRVLSTKLSARKGAFAGLK